MASHLNSTFMQASLKKSHIKKRERTGDGVKGCHSVMVYQDSCWAERSVKNLNVTLHLPRTWLDYVIEAKSFLLTGQTSITNYVPLPSGWFKMFLLICINFNLFIVFFFRLRLHLHTITHLKVKWSCSSDTFPQCNAFDDSTCVWFSQMKFAVFKQHSLNTALGALRVCIQEESRTKGLKGWSLIRRITGSKLNHVESNSLNERSQTTQHNILLPPGIYKWPI